MSSRQTWLRCVKRRRYKPNQDEHLALPHQNCLTCHFDPGKWQRVWQSWGEQLFLQKETISAHRTSCLPPFFLGRGRKSLRAIHANESRASRRPWKLGCAARHPRPPRGGSAARSLRARQPLRTAPRVEPFPLSAPLGSENPFPQAFGVLLVVSLNCIWERAQVPRGRCADGGFLLFTEVFSSGLAVWFFFFSPSQRAHPCRSSMVPFTCRWNRLS